MLIFTLKKEWYEKIKSGEKTVEYREVKDYWATRLYSTIYFLKLVILLNIFVAKIFITSS